MNINAFDRWNNTLRCQPFTKSVFLWTMALHLKVPVRYLISYCDSIWIGVRLDYAFMLRTYVHNYIFSCNRVTGNIHNELCVRTYVRMSVDAHQTSVSWICNVHFGAVQLYDLDSGDHAHKTRRHPLPICTKRLRCTLPILWDNAPKTRRLRSQVLKATKATDDSTSIVVHRQQLSENVFIYLSVIQSLHMSMWQRCQN